MVSMDCEVERLVESGKIFFSWVFIFERVNSVVVPLAIFSSWGDRLVDLRSL